MMSDLVERLRSDGEDERQRFRESRCTLAPLLNEAAAEIERLRAREKDLTLEGLGLIGRIEQTRDALRDILSKSCDAFYETANMLDDEDYCGEVPGRSGTLIGHREEYHRYMVEVLTKAGDAAREALTAMEQRT